MKQNKQTRKIFPGACRSICFLFLILLISLVSQTARAEEQSVERGKIAENRRESFTIAVASDLHLDPEPSGFMVNPLFQYNMEITDALLYDVIRQNADVLFLTGDITNSGGERAHTALIQKLEVAKEQGLQTYVLPGNHDLTKEQTEQFAELYKDFGYADAYSRDTDSLSYSILINTGANSTNSTAGESSDTGASADLLLLMLDTDGYTYRTNGAYLSETSLRWVEEQLKKAADKKYEILVAGHYSILAGQTTDFVGKEALIAILEKYQVPLYLCGHLHQRYVSSQNHLTELVVDQSIAYPCSYALINKTGKNDYQYSPRKIDVSAWAHESRQTSEDLLNFDEYAENIFLERSEETILLLKGKHYLSKRKTRQTIEFFRQVQKEYLDGTLSEHKKEIYKSPGYKTFMKIADGTTYGRWIPTFIENASPYTAGFRLKDNMLLLGTGTKG